LQENLAESELFGHKRGSFTGAIRDKRGILELADGGDLFLDEIGDLPLHLQVKLLRALQEGEIVPVGSTQIKKINVRVICATKQNIEELVNQGRFREDLYYRINVIRIHVPPLHERKEDIQDLAPYFLFKLFGRQFRIEDEAVKLLSQQEWPGNIRELKNWLERAAIKARQRNRFVIQKEDFDFKSPNLTRTSVYKGVLPKTAADVSEDSYLEFLHEAERHYLKTAIELCQGKASLAAERLGLAKSTVYEKMKALGLIHPKSSQGRDGSSVAHLA
jgi:transcriptional regulator with GAF, ATPase, and Fis domain